MNFTSITSILQETLKNTVTDNKIAFEIGSIPVSWYGIIAFFGFLIAIGFAFCKVKWWYKIPMEPIFYFAFIAIPVSILGARCWSFIIGDSKITADAFGAQIVQFFNLKTGGLAIQGGVLFVLLAGVIYFPLMLKKPKYQIRTMKEGKEHIKPVSSFLYADAIIPCVLIGQALGRWGNFINGELYGAAVSNGGLDWLEKVMPAVYTGMTDRGNIGVVYQPLFLYESFGDFWIFIILYFAVEFMRFHKVGDISAGYFVGYGILRLAMEPLRDAQFKFATTYVTCSIEIVCGIAFILYNHLWLAKHRDIRYLYEFWIKFSYGFKVMWASMSKSYASKLNMRDPNRERYGLAKNPQFRRTPDQIYYYKGH